MADFRYAGLKMANLHRIRERMTAWDNSNREEAYKTDPELAEAEDWKPVY